MDSGNQSPDERRIPFGFIFLLLLLALAIFVGFIILRPRVPPTLTIKLKGYTNDAAGIRHAIIFLRNDSATPVYAYMPRAIMQCETNHQMFDTFMPPIPWTWNATLPPANSSTFMMPIPTNGLPWRLHLYVYNDIDRLSVLKRYLTLRRLHPFFVDSDWFEPPPR